MNRQFRRHGFRRLDEVDVRIPRSARFDPNPRDVSFTKFAKDEEDREQAKLDRQRKNQERMDLYSKYGDVINRIKNSDDKLETAFEELVPPQGIADTVAGEIVRAMMRVLYRDYNDGDKFFMGYGLETCGSSICYLADKVPGAEDKIIKIINELEGIDPESSMFDDLYTKELTKLSEFVVNYLLDSPELFATKNTEDSRSDWNTDWLEGLQPLFDYDCQIPEGIMECIDRDLISERDLIDEVGEWEYGGYYLNDYNPDISMGYINLYEMPYELYQELCDQFYRNLTQYEKDLLEEHKDQLIDEDEDELIDEEDISEKDLEEI